MGPWQRAALWFFPIFLWAAWIAYAAHDLDGQRAAIRSEAHEPGQSLSGCLDFALDNFSTPSETKREACQARYEDAVAEAERKRPDHEHRIRFDVLSLAGAAGVMLGYFVLVPRRWRAGLRAWIIIVVFSALLAAVTLLLILMGMPRSD